MDRKQIKRAGKTSFKKHYLMFVAACAIAAFLGVQYAGTLAGYGFKTVAGESGEFAVFEDFFEDGVFDHMIKGEPEKGESLSKELKEQSKNKSVNISVLELGRNKGAFATLVNTYESGSIYVTLWKSINSMVGSRSMSVAIFIVICLLVAAFVQFFVIDVFRAILKRVALEARIYESVPVRKFLFFVKCRRWFKVAIGLLYTQMFQFLWDLTIIGGMIKHYSYALVPYIVAENPDISAKDALNLSKRMMKGHKWELFVFDLSFLGWQLLGILTIGLLNVLYTNPYKEAAMAEYYAKLREKVKTEKLDKSDLLNDEYLYAYANESIINEEYENEKKLFDMPMPVEPEYKGISGFFAKNLGIVLSINDKEKQYNECIDRRSKLASYKKILAQKEYPLKLNPLTKNARIKRTSIETFRYTRHYSILSIVLMFFIFSFGGWLWEVGLTIIKTGVLANRGTLHGPWLPIYGSGCMLILICLTRIRRKPILSFIVAMILCGTIEYMTSVVLEMLYNQKWWNYEGFFLNINGRICAEGLLVFGFGGMMIMYFVAPLLDKLLQKIKLKVMLPICLVLIILFTGDLIYSSKYPNTGVGVNGDTAKIEYIDTTYQRL